jgi:hypothetical protein
MYEYYLCCSLLEARRVEIKLRWCFQIMAKVVHVAVIARLHTNIQGLWVTWLTHDVCRSSSKVPVYSKCSQVPYDSALSCAFPRRVHSFELTPPTPRMKN